MPISGIRSQICPSNRQTRRGTNPPTAFPPWPFFGADSAIEYCVDAWQRPILRLDILRQRGNNSLEQNACKVAHVLRFDAELLLDGRLLNYALVHVVPPKSATIDRRQRPFIVFRSTRGPLRRHLHRRWLPYPELRGFRR